MSLDEMEKMAIERLQFGSQLSLEYYEKPLLLCYSGGKDSDVILHIAKKAGIPFEIQHSLTTVDAPETVRHVKKVFAELEKMGIATEITKPKLSMWQLIEKKGVPPQRNMRYCCSILKETSGKNRSIITGVRKFESNGRKDRTSFEAIGKTKKEGVKVDDEIMLSNDNGEKRMFMERCEIKGKTVVNPIIEWKDVDVWNYIRKENIEINPLYDKGFKRVGCIGCPLATPKQIKNQFAMYPTYKRAYTKAFQRMIDRRKELGKPVDERWKDGEAVMKWYLDEDINQVTLFDDLEG